ncbi:MAG: hypothetical protein ACRCSV_04500 [Chlamydiales bacterium]
MADSFRIVSGDGKTPEISKKLTDTTIIEKIHKMDPATAYVAVQGVMVPNLNQLQKKFSYLSTNASDLESPIHLSIPKSEKSSFIESSKSIDKIKSDLQDIQIRMKELEKNAKKILDLRIDSKSKDTKITAKDLWTYPNDDKFWNDPESHGGIFGRFFALKGVLEKRLASLQKELMVLQKNMPKSPLVKTLQETIKYLLENIPKTSSKWNKKDWTYGGLAWKFKWDSVNTWWVAWDEYSQNKGSPDSTGFLDLVQNKENFAKYIQGVDKSLKDIDKFTSTKEFHLLKLKSLDTQAAYMYLTNVILPSLQNQSAEILEKHSETMKQVSKIYDKWNEIQDEINETTKTLRDLQEGKSIGELDITITKIENYHRKSDNTHWKIATIEDPKGYFNITINKKVAEFKELLKEAKKKLPSTSKELINTLDTLADSLHLEDNYEKGYYNFNWNYSGVFKFEIQTKDIPDFTDNSDFEKMKKIIWDRVTGGCRFLIDSDQTKAKIYVDNVNQGFTALTSVSNITQQELQMATQYYNSLLGLQKNLIDSINKVIQLATKTPNY